MPRCSLTSPQEAAHIIYKERVYTLYGTVAQVAGHSIAYRLRLIKPAHVARGFVQKIGTQIKFIWLPLAYMHVAHCYCGSPLFYLLNFRVKNRYHNLQLVFVVFFFFVFWTEYLLSLWQNGLKIERLMGKKFIDWTVEIWVGVGIEGWWYSYAIYNIYGRQYVI